MRDPCVKCPCILRKTVCRKFCTVYKAAVRHDVHIGMIVMGSTTHDRIARALK